MEISKERLKVWDTAHRSNDEGFLSGCKFHETLDYVHLTDILKGGDKVLEIGVGMGYVTREFKDKGYDISGFDIVQVALDRVKDYCTTYSFDQINDLPSDYFDVIICNNVVQHVPTPLLKYELYYFIRSLKKGGVMAIKSCSADGWDDTGCDPDLIIQTDRPVKCDESIGIFCRSIPFFIKMIAEYGGLTEIKADIPCYTNKRFSFITGIQIYHVTK